MFINVNKLSNKVGSINNSIKNYETNLFDTLSCLKNMKYSWYDGYTISFFNNVDKEISNANNIIDDLNNILNIIRSIANNYDRLGRSINGYNGYINSDNLNYNSSDIEDNQLYNNNIRNQINNIEDNISTHISKISLSNINSISYHSLDVIQEDNDFVGMKDNMVNEIKKLEIKLNSLKSSSISLINVFQINSDIYNSTNYYKLRRLIEQINSDLNTINNNINNAYNYVKKRELEIYKINDSLIKGINDIK